MKHREDLEEAERKRESKGRVPLSLSGKGFTRSQADHIYINVSAPPARPPVAGASSYAISLLDKRDQPIIENPEDWYLSVVRFNMPMQMVPICFMGIYTGEIDDAPNTNFNLTNYAVTIVAPDGTPFQSEIVWTPDDLEAPVPVLPAGDSITSKFITDYVDYFSLYNYNHFLGLWNAAFADAFAIALSNESFAATGATLPPYITLDETTGYLSIWAQNAYDSTLESPIMVFLNSELEEFVQNSFEQIHHGFTPVNFNGGAPAQTDYQIVIRNRGNNAVANIAGNPPINVTLTAASADATLTVDEAATIFQYEGASGLGLPAGVSVVSVDYKTGAVVFSANATTSGTFPIQFSAPGYQMRQEFACLINWSDLVGLAFTTGTLPVKTEQAALAYANQEGTYADGQPIGTTAAGIISLVTDFVASSSGSGTDLRTFITYVPTSEYRLSSLIAGESLDTITLKMQWFDSFSNYFQMFCTHNNSCSAKLLFRKKALGAGIGPHDHSYASDISGGSASGCVKCATGGCDSCGGKRSGLKGVM
jgi:hypothetical protein